MRRTLPLIAALMLAAPAMAQTHVNGSISLIRTGWNADSFAVQLNVPTQDPAFCGTADGYITHVSLPGYRTYYAAALTAYSMKQPVTVVVHNSECYGGRPKLIGINMAP